MQKIRLAVVHHKGYHARSGDVVGLAGRKAVLHLELPLVTGIIRVRGRQRQVVICRPPGTVHLVSVCIKDIDPVIERPGPVLRLIGRGSPCERRRRRDSGGLKGRCIRLRERYVLEIMPAVSLIPLIVRNFKTVKSVSRFLSCYRMREFTVRKVCECKIIKFRAVIVLIAGSAHYQRTEVVRIDPLQLDFEDRRERGGGRLITVDAGGHEPRTGSGLQRNHAAFGPVVRPMIEIAVLNNDTPLIIYVRLQYGSRYRKTGYPGGSIIYVGRSFRPDQISIGIIDIDPVNLPNQHAIIGPGQCRTEHAAVSMQGVRIHHLHLVGIIEVIITRCGIVRRGINRCKFILSGNGLTGERKCIHVVPGGIQNLAGQLWPLYGDRNGTVGRIENLGPDPGARRNRAGSRTGRIGLDIAEAEIRRQRPSRRCDRHAREQRPNRKQ